MNTHRSTRRRPHVIDPAKVAWTIVLFVALASILVAAAPSFAQSSPKTTQSGTTGPKPTAAAVPVAPEDEEKALHDAQNPIASTMMT